LLYLRRNRWRLLARTLWASPRAWAFAGALCTRGAGFIASFSLARHAGASFLALYISTVITGAAVAAPLGQVLFNSGTLAAAAAPSVRWVRRLLRANLMLGTALLLPVTALFAAMHWPVASGMASKLNVSLVWLVVAGFSTVAGQVFVSILTGMLNGLGAQLQSARMTAVMATVLMGLSYPAVLMFGIDGAWAVLLLSAWLPVLLLLYLVRHFLAAAWRPLVNVDDVVIGRPMAVALSHLRAGIPSALAVMASGLASWFCSIYLVQRYLGAQEVAVLAVANQWLTLILMPVTSWGGVILKELAELRLLREGAQQLPVVLRRLIVRNIAITAVVALCVVLGAEWIESGYRLQGHGLPAILLVSGVAALMGSVYGVLERVLICWDRQWQLMVFSFVGLAVQVAFTYALVERSLVVVQFGVLMASLTSIALVWWFMKGLHGGTGRALAS
jgi:O-antigen/teichoic acid export membrane protein